MGLYFSKQNPKHSDFTSELTKRPLLEIQNEVMFSSISKKIKSSQQSLDNIIQKHTQILDMLNDLDKRIEILELKNSNSQSKKIKVTQDDAHVQTNEINELSIDKPLSNINVSTKYEIDISKDKRLDFDYDNQIKEIEFKANNNANKALYKKNRKGKPDTFQPLFENKRDETGKSVRKYSRKQSTKYN
jgi:hypothetical protein